MFQNFNATTSPETAKERIAAIRDEMAKEKLDAFLIPRADAHQGEYVSARDNRLAWATSFTGSAGYAAVTADTVGLFVDGRYTLQVRDQTDESVFTYLDIPNDNLGTWLNDTLGANSVVGYDAWLYTKSQLEALQREAPDLVFKASANVLDRVWTDQPAPPLGKMVPYPLEYAGVSHEEKITELAQNLTNSGLSAAVLTQPDSIAWLLNSRGSDVGQSPITLGFAILHADAKVDLFMHEEKSDAALQTHLGPAVTIYASEKFDSKIKALNGKVQIDKARAPVILSDWLGDKVAYGDDPCLLPKACKNQAELEGTTKAHIRDGVAMVRFLHHVATLKELPTEIDIVKSLEAFRSETGALKNISFDTICGSGPNGAIVHYRVTEGTNRQLQNNEVLLVDSGGQYLDGTTDITRTIAIGKPPLEAREAFTLVLKGMIAISVAQFPKGLTGRDIDALARAPLWAQGMDYDHGTGHGVGVYLNVHEGPQNLSRKSEVPLEKGMIISNEPGYYKAGEYGIRIENLIYVVDAPKGADDREMFAFETLTHAPIDRNMVIRGLLTKAEVAWLDSYHRQVRETLLPHLEGDAADWLNEVTKELFHDAKNHD